MANATHGVANSMANRTNAMANDRCPDCGGLYALIGYRHLCKRSRGLAATKVPVIAAAPADARGRDAQDKDGPREASTYRYRDQEKRRAYQREFMRAWRAKEKPNAQGG